MEFHTFEAVIIISRKGNSSSTHSQPTRHDIDCSLSDAFLIILLHWTNQRCSGGFLSFFSFFLCVLFIQSNLLLSAGRKISQERVCHDFKSRRSLHRSCMKCDSDKVLMSCELERRAHPLWASTKEMRKAPHQNRHHTSAGGATIQGTDRSAGFWFVRSFDRAKKHCVNWIATEVFFFFVASFLSLLGFTMVAGPLVRGILFQLNAFVFFENVECSLIALYPKTPALGKWQQCCGWRRMNFKNERST